MPQRSYGDIADTVLPTAVFTLDTLTVLSQSIDKYVALPSQDRLEFFQETMQSLWPAPIDWAHRPQSEEFKCQWAVSTIRFDLYVRKGNFTH